MTQFVAISERTQFVAKEHRNASRAIVPLTRRAKTGPTGIRTQNQRIMLTTSAFAADFVCGLDHAFTVSRLREV